MCLGLVRNADANAYYAESFGCVFLCRIVRHSPNNQRMDAHSNKWRSSQSFPRNIMNQWPIKIRSADSIVGCVGGRGDGTQTR